LPLTIAKGKFAMIHLNIPFWLFGAIVGTVCCVLLATALAIGYRVRRLKSRQGHASSMQAMAASLLTNHFQQNLMSMQVDAVFDSLAALIETERIKLKALVAPAYQTVTISETLEERVPPRPVAAEPSDPPEARKADVPSAEPGNPANHNRTCAWSQAELDLAEKMRQLQADPKRRLEAVA
jgi:hypothetical protein